MEIKIGQFMLVQLSPTEPLWLYKNAGTATEEAMEADQAEFERVLKAFYDEHF